jgi:hypothetical protein
MNKDEYVITATMIFIVAFISGAVLMGVLDTLNEDKFITSVCKLRYGNNTFVDFHTELAMVCIGGDCSLNAYDVYVNGTFIGKIVDKYSCEVVKK